MNKSRVKSSASGLGLLISILALVCLGAHAQTCLTAEDMDPATKSALLTTGKNYFDMAAHGNSASLRQNSIASLAGSFGRVETAVNDHKTDFSSAQATSRPPFLLTAEGSAPLDKAEFLCGVFGSNGQTANSAEFVIPNLPPGQYGIVILDVSGAKQPYTVSFVLQKDATAWKLAGFYIFETQANGHNGDWFASRARDFKAKGQTHNAWLYYLQSLRLISPLPFMYTLRTDKLYEEAQTVKPADFPVDGKSAGLVTGGQTYKLTTIETAVVGKDLDLLARYDSQDVSNTSKSFQDNMTVMKTLLAKFPELRDAFAGIEARAVEPSGRDYGTLMSMKDIK